MLCTCLLVQRFLKCLSGFHEIRHQIDSGLIPKNNMRHKRAEIDISVRDSYGYKTFIHGLLSFHKDMTILLFTWTTTVSLYSADVALKTFKIFLLSKIINAYIKGALTFYSGVHSWNTLFAQKNYGANSWWCWRKA